MGCLNKEQAVFEQLTISDLKEWRSLVLKNFNNYTTTMTSNSEKNNNIVKVVFLSLLLIFEFIQQAALVNFTLYLNICRILKVSFQIF